MATLLSVNVGMPKDVAWRGRTVHTGVWKTPVTGPQMLRRLNLDGDGQGDLAGHGGEQRAVLAYQIESYRHWQEFLGRDDLGHGAFGENLTVEGLADDEVCIGDRYRIGEAELEVTQPRVTCFRVGMRLEEPRLPSLLVAHHRPGFYLRVITEGRVSAGDEIVRTRRGPHGLTVAETDALLYLPGHDRERLTVALDVPALSPGWQESFRSMLADDAEARPAGIAVAPPPAWAGFRTLTVTDVVAESAAVTSYRFAADDALPPYRPGQFLTLRVPGAGDPPPVRSYSLSGDPDGGYRISVKRESHGLVSAYLREDLRRGGRVEVAAPRGDFVLEDGTGPVLLISAGIGLTPVLAMLHALASAASERDVWWVHTTHDAASHAFSGEVADLLAALPSSHSLVFYTSPAEPLGPRLGRPDRAPHGRGGGRPRTARPTGRRTSAARSRSWTTSPPPWQPPASTPAASTPSGSGRRRRSTRAWSVPTRHLRTSRPGEPGSGPDVTFARSGLTTAWSDAYASVLELAEACDVPTQWSCRSGVCHTCATAVLSGEASYDVPPLEPPGPDELLICSAQPTEELVLDL